MVLHEIHDLSNQYVSNILTEGLSKITDPDIIANYHPAYSHEPANLFYVLRAGRFRESKGTYYVLEDSGQLVCSAGWNEYGEDPRIALALTRMYTDPLYRGKYFVAGNILTRTLEETKHYNNVWLTMNEHNKSLYTWFVRASQNKSTALFNDWPDIYRQFKPLGEKIIYNTKQFVVELKRNNMHENKLALLQEGLREIRVKTKVDLETISPSTLIEDLNLDSLEMVELLMFYEEKTGKIVPDPDKNMKTVDDLLKVLP